VPFPEAEEAPPPPASEGPFETNPRASGSQLGAAAAAAPPRPKPSGPPVLKRKLSPAVFLGIVAVLLLAFVGSIFAIKSRYAKPAAVNTSLETRVRRQRQLSAEADQLLKQGRVDDAYAKYEELHRIAPNSPAVTSTLQRLSLIRQQQQSTQQQIQQAAQKFDEGVALYNARKYDDAVKAFDASFKLNAARQETANYLYLAQQQADRVRAEQLARQQQRMQVTQNTSTARTATAPQPLPQPPPQPVNTTPALITTTFTHPFTDGTILVKVGADVVASQPLWRETRVLHRREPQVVNLSKALTPKNADVEIWVDVPSKLIREHHVLPRQNFAPGATRQLIVSFDAASKVFAYKLN
jgi:hypothetical protein